MEKHSPISVAATYHLTPQDHVWGNSPLHSACYHGKLDVVQLLILNQPNSDINLRNHRGDSPLTLACQAGHLDVIHFLLTLSSCDINHTNKAGDTPLHVACTEGHTAAVKVLCSSDKSAVESRNKHGNLPLALACKGGHLDVVKFLIESMHSSTSIQNKDGDTPLHVACSHGNSQVVKFLLAISNSDINTKNADGNTSLHLACRIGWKHIVEFLVNEINNINVNHRNNDGNTPLHVAISSHQKDIANLLSRHHKCNTKITNKDGNMSLHLVCMEGWTDIVQYLLGIRRNDVNAQNINGNTPLHISCLKGHTNIVKIIITQKSCDINHKNECGNTPLNLACLEGKLDTVRLLVDMKQCDLNHKNKAGVCALHLAFYNCHQNVVDVLIRHNRCDVNCTDAVENTPLGLAANLGWTDVVEFLITKKQCNINHLNKFGDTPLHLSKCVSVAELLTCDVNCKNSRGDTALSIACQHNLDFVKFLIKTKHCKVKTQNEDGDSPLHHACRNGKLSIVKYLLSKRLLPVNCENNTGDTPLCVAVEAMRTDVVQFLVDIDDCDVNHQNKNGDTPLHIACRIGYIRVVRALTDFRNRKFSCNFNVENNYQQTPALIAFHNQSNDIFRLLVTEHHCDCLFNVLESIDKDRWPEVVRILAIGKSVSPPTHLKNRISVVRFLFEKRVWNLNGLDVHGNTPLHIACLTGDLDFFTLLNIDKLNVKNNHEETPALIAFNRHHNDIFRLLVTEHHCERLFSALEGIDKDRWPEVVSILTVGRSVSLPKHLKYKIGVVRFLFEERVWDLNGLDVHGNTPLHIACLAGDLNVVRFLTGFIDCKLNVKNNNQETPALIAFNRHHNDIFRLLVTEHHYECLLSVLKDVNKEFCFKLMGMLTVGRTAKVPSVLESPFDIIHFLYKERVWDLNGLDVHGNTPLHIASLAGDQDVISILLKFSVTNCNVQNANGDMPLHIACKAGNFTVAHLINHPNCNLNCQNSTGDTPLHLACRLDARSIGIIHAVKALISHEKCSMDIQNHDGDTPLTLACHFANQLIVQQLLNTNKCNINHQNKDRNSPLHNACRSGNLTIVEALLTKNCNIILRNRQGETPALVAFNHQHPDILRLLVTEQHCEYLIDLLEMISKEKWPDVVNILIGDRILLIPTFSSALDVVKLMVHNQFWNIKCLDESGNSALHHACYYGHTGLVQYLVDDQKFVIMHNNSCGDTPLHYACLQGHSEVVKAMLSAISSMTTVCKPDIPNNQGDTPLHLSCSKGHQQVVKILLSSGLFDSTACNVAGFTPVQLARSYQMIKELVSQHVSFQSSTPQWSNIKVCLVGNHGTGKTTLVQVLQRETKLWMKVVPKRLKKVSNVESCTCGIIPVHLHSKRFGNVILYDFAGHMEYYSSHAAVLENFRSSSPPPLFIILIKLVESEEEIIQRLYYWTSMIENHCKTTMSSPRVIVVGSFADKVKEFLPQKVEHVKRLLGLLDDEPLSSLCSLQFVGFVSLDCRILASQDNDTLCNLLAENCHALQETADTSFGCHVLYALISDKFKDNVACTVFEIMKCIHSDDTNEDLLPHDTDELVHLLKTLSDYGELLLLQNQDHPQNSWVILNKSVLLSEVNGTVFAPEQFERRYKGFLMSTGVVPLSKIQEAFPKYNSEMITSFLTHLEFCQEVKDPDALGGITATHVQLTQSTTPSAVTERYFFFPALVNLEKPTNVWKDSESIHFNSGWLLQCVKPDKFFTSRFIHVLLLRLAFSYALTPETYQFPEDPSYPVLRKRCSVWKNGIQWWSRAGGIETIVEVREQTKLVTILMRCPAKAETECAKLRSSVIEKVLSVQKEFCPAVTPMAECLIHPNDVQYPLPSTQQLQLFSHKEIAALVIANSQENEQFAIEESSSSVMDAQKLLSFEPYLGLGEALVQQLFSDNDAHKIVSENFLNKLAENVFERMLLFKKMLNTPENEFAECQGQAQVRQCYYLFKLWSQQRDKATYGALREEFDRYSIFHGRNPLDVVNAGSSLQEPSGGFLSQAHPTQDMDDDTWDIRDAPTHDPPTLLEIVRFRGWERRINVPQEIGVHYMTFGTLLLEDPNGMRIRNMERKHMKDAEEINMEVLQEWVEGRGKQPVSWDTLIGVLRDTALTILASEIAAVKGSSGE